MSKTLDLLRDGKGQPEERIKYFGIDPTKDSSTKVIEALVSFELNYEKSKKAEKAKHPAVSGFDMAIAAIARLRGIEMESKQNDTGVIPRFDKNGACKDFVHRPFILGRPKINSAEHQGQSQEELSRQKGFMYGLSVLSRDEVFEGNVKRLVRPVNVAELPSSDDVLAVLTYGSNLLITQTLDHTNTQAFEMGFYGTFPSNFESLSAFTIVDINCKLGKKAVTATQSLVQPELV